MIKDTRYTEMYGGKVNTTCLDPMVLVEERGIIHRDYWAHLFRWSFVGKLLKRGQRILDIGAGPGKLGWVLYRNKMKPACYHAIEIKKENIVKLMELAAKVNFPVLVHQADIRKVPWLLFPGASNLYDYICCFEVIEHFEPEYLPKVLNEMKELLAPTGRILLSTPNYDGVHKAKNHIHEYWENELAEHFMAADLIVEEKYGTFMSLGTIYQAKKILNRIDYNVFLALYPYYNASILSCFFAPMYPSKSRNILWVLKK